MKLHDLPMKSEKMGGRQPMMAAARQCTSGGRREETERCQSVAVRKREDGRGREREKEGLNNQFFLPLALLLYYYFPSLFWGNRESRD